VLTVGDFGDAGASGIINQEKVAVVMSDWCGSRGCDFIVSTGDNFYEDGVTSVDDPRFNTSWRWVYDKPNIDTQQWYMSLGNHDFGVLDNRELFQVWVGYVQIICWWVFLDINFSEIITNGTYRLYSVSLNCVISKRKP